VRSSSRMTITAHGAERLRQRGFRQSDFEIVADLGSDLGQGIFLRKKDVKPELRILAKALAEIRRERTGDPETTGPSEREIIWQMERLLRLVGTYIPTANGCALSIYRPCNRRLKHILRGRRAYSRLRQIRGRR
jgi:hypothetical protein